MQLTFILLIFIQFLRWFYVVIPHNQSHLYTNPNQDSSHKILPVHFYQHLYCFKSIYTLKSAHKMIEKQTYR